MAAAQDEQAWNDRQLRAPPRPAWRLWRYREPAVVLGVGQRTLEDSTQCAPVAVLRRRAGGGAVLVGPWMLGLSVALPADHPLVEDGLLPAYRWLGETVARALSFDGVRCHALEPQMLPGHAAAARDWACFGSLSPWEVLCDGRKIAGLAQVRTRDVVLLVGGVLLRRPDWELLCLVLGQPAHEAQRLDAATCDWQRAAQRCGGSGDGSERVAVRLRAQIASSLRGAR